MMNWWDEMFGGSFMPHGHCYLWRSSIVWLNVVPDILIVLAYYSIPIFLTYLVHRANDVPFMGFLILFSAFILSCGTTHLMEIINIWHSQYVLAGFVKVITASLSVATAIALWRSLPQIIKFIKEAKDW